MTTSIQTTRRKDDSVMYEEDKDSVILRLRVELAQERAKRKELALVERDWSRERARTEHALERALVDERVHGLELEASRVKLRERVGTFERGEGKLGTGEGEGETRDGAVGGEMRTREKERGEGRAEFAGGD